MKTINSEALDLLDTGRFNTRTTVMINADGGDLGLWDDLSEVEIGGETFNPGSGVFTVSSIGGSLDLSVHGIEVVFNRLNPDALNLLSQGGYHQRPITVSNLILNHNGAILSSNAFFSGYIDQGAH